MLKLQYFAALIAVMGILAITLLTSCSQGHDDPIIWRLAISSADTLQTNLLQEFADNVKADTKNRLEIKIIKSAFTYLEPDVFDTVSSGEIDLGYVNPTTYFIKAPATASISIYSSAIATSLPQLVALNTTLAKEFSVMIDEANRNNITHLLWGPLGSVDSFFKFPVSSMADVKEKKLGCSPGVAPIVQILGATPEIMDWADFYVSAQKGVVDGWILGSLEDYVTMKFYEVAPYLVNFRFNSIMSVLMNQSSFDALPADIQKVVTDDAAAIQAKWITQVKASDDGYIAQMQANPNVHVEVLTEDERAAWFNGAIIPVLTISRGPYMTADQVAEAKSIIDNVQATVN